jgi:branched-chain amino acid aminotransferase
MFEGIRSYEIDGKPFLFRLGEHVERFLKSAAIYDMTHSFSKKQIEDAIVETVRKNKLGASYVRPLFYFGSWKNPSPTKRQPSTELTIFALPVKGSIEKWEGKKGLRCTVSSWRKPAPNALPANAKCAANYATSYLAALEAEKKGYDYGLLLDHRGMISEGLASNIFAVFNGELVTTPPHASILGGITRESVIQIARDEKMKFAEREIRPEELLKADEVFVTGTASEVEPVVEIDGKVIGKGEAGPVTQKLANIYHEIIQGKNRRYLSWLTPV